VVCIPAFGSFILSGKVCYREAASSFMGRFGFQSPWMIDLSGKALKSKVTLTQNMARTLAQAGAGDKIF